MRLSSALRFDAEHVLHPYTSMTRPLPTYMVRSALGPRLELIFEDEKKLGNNNNNVRSEWVIDGMSSWWCAMHGYRHKVLDEALQKQAQESMAHVMFGGLTHLPAVNLAEMLLDIAGPPMTKVFFCDSGSVSVEVAIKMALQYCFRTGKKNKTKLATITKGYHGDTFGAMSVCDPVGGMHHMFQDILPKHFFIPTPTCSFREKECSQGHHSKCECNKTCTAAFEMEKLLKEKGDQIAAVILEPIVQGAGGMRFYSPSFLRKVKELCVKYDVLLIADEIATGFGRTGEMLACDFASIRPDILCLGKALTGGYMTMGATLTTDKIAEGISRDNGVFNHGPTFMGNPLACSVALASTKLLLSQDWKAKVQMVETRLRSGLDSVSRHPRVRDVRVLGAIGVCELNEPIPASVFPKIQKAFVQNGVWLRPFGTLIYTMPPFMCPTLKPSDIDSIATAINHVISDDRNWL